MNRMDEIEKELKKIGIEIQFHGYYKTLPEIVDEINKKWDNIPLDIQNDFKKSVIHLISGEENINE